VESEDDFTLDLPTSTRSDEGTRSNLEMENVQLKLEVEGCQSELQAKDEDTAKILAQKEDELQLETALKEKEAKISDERIMAEKTAKELDESKEKLYKFEES
jgi:hypothetical protein